jgi:hypothetical protein
MGWAVGSLLSAPVRALQARGPVLRNRARVVYMSSRAIHRRPKYRSRGSEAGPPRLRRRRGPGPTRTRLRRRQAPLRTEGGPVHAAS